MSLRADREIEIDVLRKVEKKGFGPRHGKTDFYEYLEAVWELYRKWKADKKRPARRRQLAEFYPEKVKLRTNTHTIRAIIDASSDQNAQVKSRWTRALQYLEKNAAQVARVGFGSLSSAMEACSDAHAKWQVTTANYRVLGTRLVRY